MPLTRAFLSALMLLAAAGCLEEEVSLVLEKDGSGTATHLLRIHPRAHKALEDVTGEKAWRGRQSLERLLKNSGLELIRFEEKRPAFGNHEIRFQVSFKRFQDYLKADLIHHADVSLVAGEEHDLVFRLRPQAYRQRRGFDIRGYVNALEGSFFKFHARLPAPVTVAQNFSAKEREVDFSLDFKGEQARTKTAEFLVSKAPIEARFEKVGVAIETPVLPAGEPLLPDPDAVRTDFRIDMERLTLTRQTVLTGEMPPSRGTGFTGPNRLDLRLQLRCPEGVMPFGSGQVRVHQARDNSGADLVLLSGLARRGTDGRRGALEADLPWYTFGTGKRPFYPVQVSLPAPSRAAKMLTEFSGVVGIRVAAGEESITLKQEEWSSKAVAAHPDLQEMGLRVTDVQSTSVHIEGHDLERLVKIFLVPAEGDPIPNGGFSSGSDYRRFHFREMPETFSIRLVVRTGVSRVDIPFRFENIPLP